MIKYDRFWVTMKERGITQYDLYEHYQITRSLLDRLRKNKNVEIYTIDRLCSILHCEIEDIVEDGPLSDMAAAPARDEDEIVIPPVESATTSLADLFPKLDD